MRWQVPTVPEEKAIMRSVVKLRMLHSGFADSTLNPINPKALPWGI